MIAVEVAIQLFLFLYFHEHELLIDKEANITIIKPCEDNDGGRFDCVDFTNISVNCLHNVLLNFIYASKLDLFIKDTNTNWRAILCCLSNLKECSSLSSEHHYESAYQRLIRARSRLREASLVKNVATVQLRQSCKAIPPNA